jgi:hypothetical protein
MTKNLRYKLNMPNDDMVSFEWKETNKTRKGQSNYERHKNELGQKSSNYIKSSIYEKKIQWQLQTNTYFHKKITKK